MIEKLQKHEIIRHGVVIEKHGCEPREIIDKINEIIDIIYDMQLAISNLDPDSEWYDGNHIADTSKKVDPYAEQRKWIGKVCKFWDNLDTNYFLALLAEIQEKEPMPFEDYRGNQWHHCEPVKPDDDIIFKE